MGIKVCKFGGTSMADGNIIRSVAKIVNSDEDRRYVVVSAPGKRFSGDIKVTDLLYECSDEAATGMKRSEVFSKIRTRFLSIEKEIGMDIGLEAMLDERTIVLPVGNIFRAELWRRFSAFRSLTRRTSFNLRRTARWTRVHIL